MTMEVDPTYEYNAPQFVDFTQLGDVQDGADEYFDRSHDHEHIMVVSYEGRPLSASDQIPKHSNDFAEQNNNKPKELPNVCSSLEEWQARTKKPAASGSAAIAHQKTAGNATGRNSRPQTRNAHRVTANTKYVRNESLEAPSKRPCIKGIVKAGGGANKVQTSSAAATNSRSAAASQFVNTSAASSVSSVEAKFMPKPWLSHSLENHPAAAAASPRMLPSKAASLSGARQLRRRSRSAACMTSTAAPSSVSDLSASRLLDISALSVSSSASSLSAISQRVVTRAMLTRPQLTIAKTPMVLKRRAMSAAPNIKSTSQLELEKVEELKRKAGEHRRLAAQSYQASMAPPVNVPRRAVLPPTRPEEFNFATDTRAKSHGMQTRGGSSVVGGELDFVGLLRKNSPTKPLTSRTTKPKPFDLQLEKKRKRDDGMEMPPPGYKFESLGEKVLKFSTRTPDRFRPRGNHKGDTSRSDNPVVYHRPHLTIAKTPNLTTRLRARKTHVLSQVELEEIEVEEMKRNRFRANPFNKEVLDQSKNGVPRIPSRQPTVFEPFELSTGIHHAANSTTDSQDSQDQNAIFRARPVPKAILEGIVGVKPALKILPTIASSPAFQTRKSSRIAAKTVEQEPVENWPIVLSHPVPEFGEPFRPQLRHQATDVLPFSFEDRTRDMFRHKEQQIQKVYEEEERARRFRAKPMPDLSIADVPEKKTIEATKVEPFDLAVEARAEEKLKKWQEKLEAEKREQQRLKNFKARPANVLQQLPFEPQKCDQQPIDVEPFQLSTEERAAARAEYEQWRLEKEQVAERERAERERARQADEEQERARLRAEAVHRAQPIQHFKPLPPRKDIPLTDPHSPQFSERLTFKTRSGH